MNNGSPSTHSDLHPALLNPLPFHSSCPRGQDFPSYKTGCSAIGPQDDAQLRHELREQTLNLSIAGYEQLIALLLQSLGYSHVQVLRDPKRKRRSHKGRNRHGGVDLIAYSRSGLSSDTVLVQVKQYERPVSRRFVDELRGALLRTKSRHALLITTSRLSPTAVRAACEDHIAPVHLMSGEGFCRLLIQHYIGVRRNEHGTLRVDHDFFQELNEQAGQLAVEKSSARPRKGHVPSDFSSEDVPRKLTQLSAPIGQGVVKKGGEMMGRTHALFGIATLWLLEVPVAITQETIGPLVLCAVFGALAPDLDAGESKLKRLSVAGITPLAPLAQTIHQSFGHRGLLHSLLGLSLFTALCALPVAFWLGWPYGAALTLGYSSHILADSMTKSGVPLLFPRRRRYHLLPMRFRVTTGSLAEEMLLPVLAFTVLLLLMRHLYLTT